MTQRAQRLRNTTTEAEAKLWNALRRDQIEGLHFRRQHPVGTYVLDFFCPAIQLAIEIDGGQHNTDQIQASDAHRTDWLNERGILVVRYWNNDVLGNFTGVLEDLVRIIVERRRMLTPSPTLPLSGGGSERSKS
jgi:very-short-patch-repair endonuclease